MARFIAAAPKACGLGRAISSHRMTVATNERPWLYLELSHHKSMIGRSNN